MHFVTKQRAASYTILGVIALFGLITASLGYFGSGRIEAFIGAYWSF